MYQLNFSLISLNKLKKRIYLLQIVFFLSSCDYAKIKSAKDLHVGNQETNSTVLIPGYKEVLQKVIGPQCLRCHSVEGGNRGGLNLETLSETKKFAIIIRDAVNLNQMPPQRPLSEEDKELLLRWIDAGLPEMPIEMEKETADSNKPAEPSQPEHPSNPIPAPEPTPDPNPAPEEKINFLIIQKEILEPTCIRCHSEVANNRGGVNLESYKNVFDLIDEIKDSVSTNVMPPRRPLNEEQKKLLSDWIEAGAPEF